MFLIVLFVVSLFVRGETKSASVGKEDFSAYMQHAWLSRDETGVWKSYTDIDDFLDSSEGSPKDILDRLHDMFDYFYANRVSGTYLTNDGARYLDYLGPIGLQIYMRDHNQTCLDIAEAALQEAYDNRDPSTGLLRHGNSTGGWQTGHSTWTLPILWSIGGISVLNHTFEIYYENLINAYDDYYNSTTGLYYSTLLSNGMKDNSNTYAVYHISQPKAITMFYNAYEITGNMTYLNLTARLIDGWWKTRSSYNLINHGWDADTNSSVFGYVNHYDQAAWVMVLARLVREGETVLYYEGNSVNVTDILERSLDALVSTFWYESSNRWGYRASPSTGRLIDTQPEMYFASTDRAVLMACTALNNLTYMEHAKKDLINSYDALKETEGDATGLIHHGDSDPDDIRLRQNLVFAQTGYLFYNKYRNVTFKNNADTVLSKISFFEESTGVYRDREPEDTFYGEKQYTFYFVIDEVQNQNNSTILSIIPQANFFNCEWYDPISSGYMTWVQESTPPVTVHDYDGLWHTIDFTIHLTTTNDLSGVTETYYKINDGPTQNVSAHGQPIITTESADNRLEYWSVYKASPLNEETHKILTGIKLDKTAPTGSIKINNDDAYTTSTSVTLTLTATDATSGVCQVRFSNDGVWDTEPWETFSTSKDWVLPSGDGSKTVYYQIRDNARLVSEINSDTIILDSTKPTASAGQNRTVNVGETVIFDASGSTVNTDIISYEWDFGDGTTGTGVITTHTYTNPGTYKLTLTVKDAAGNTDTNIITVTVVAPQAFPIWIIGAMIIAGIIITIAIFFKKHSR